MPTDTSERGLERLICTALAGHPCDPHREDTIGEPPVSYGGVGWSCGNPYDYDREYCVDLVQLGAFLRTTQPETAESLALDEEGPTRRKFLARLQGEISKGLFLHWQQWSAWSRMLCFVTSANWVNRRAGKS